MIPKFRAWVENEKQMYNIVTLQFSLTGEPNMIQAVPINETPIMDSFINSEVVGNEFELLQWTGLKDKEGTEIYEGDIVKGQHPVDFEKRPFIGRVFYWDGAWYHGFHNDRPPKRMWEYVEVIGNIYENPELLEGE